MSAESLQKLVVGAYEEAQRQLNAFYAAMDERNTRAAADALQNAARAICAGLTEAVQDRTFWAEAAELLKQASATPAPLKAVLDNLERVAEEEAKILKNGGYSAQSVSALLGDFEITLEAFREFPSGNTVELARARVTSAQEVICELEKRGVEIARDNLWGRAYRRVKSCLKSFSGVGTMVCDVATAGAAFAASGGVLAPLALGVAAVSVTGGIVTIIGVGEDIYGGLTIRRP
jgi:hypothetical protein